MHASRSDEVEVRGGGGALTIINSCGLGDGHGVTDRNRIYYDTRPAALEQKNRGVKTKNQFFIELCVSGCFSRRSCIWFNRLNSTWLVAVRLDTTRHVRRVVRVTRVATSVSSVSRRACFNMADDEEAAVLACTSLVFCALDLHQSQEQLVETIRRIFAPRCGDAPERVSCESRLSRLS